MKIAVTGKGGVGKTTIAASLCYAFAEKEYTVVAIDADPDANLASALGFPEDMKITPIMRWVIFSIVVTFFVIIFTYSGLVYDSNIWYLLSAISQSLAAIFTLVFTITIFGSQMMGRFTSIDKIMDNWTKTLMVLFTIGIIFPLIQLGKLEYSELNISFITFNFDFNLVNLAIAIDLGIATFCVLAIIPYLMRVNQIMKYERGISKLDEKLNEAEFNNDATRELNIINDLIELCISGVYDNAEWAVIEIIDILKKKHPEYQKEVTKGLKKILDISKKTNSFFVLKELKIIFIEIHEHKLEESASQKIGDFEEIMRIF